MARTAVREAFLQQALSSRSACTPTPAPSLTSEPTSELNREAVDAGLSTPTGPNGEPLEERLAASMAEGAKKVISWDGQGVVHILGFDWTLGGAALTLPMLVQALLQTFPGLQKLVIEHNNIGLLSPLVRQDARIEETTKVDRRTVPSDGFVMNFKNWVSEGTEILHLGYLLAQFRDWVEANNFDIAYSFFRALALKVPDRNQARYVRQLPASDVIFVNHLAKMNAEDSKRALPSWVTLIKALIKDGRQVEINGGVPNSDSDSESVRSLQEALAAVGIQPNQYTLRSLSLPELMDYFPTVAGVITVDTGIFHLAGLWRIPTVVLRGGWSYKWVPKPSEADYYRDVPIIWHHEGIPWGQDWLDFDVATVMRYVSEIMPAAPADTSRSTSSGTGVFESGRPDEHHYGGRVGDEQYASEMGFSKHAIRRNSGFDSQQRNVAQSKSNGNRKIRIRGLTLVASTSLIMIGLALRIFGSKNIILWASADIVAVTGMILLAVLYLPGTLREIADLAQAFRLAWKVRPDIAKRAGWHLIRLAIGAIIGLCLMAYVTEPSLLIRIWTEPRSIDLSLSYVLGLFIFMLTYEIHTLGHYLFGKFAGADITLRIRRSVPSLLDTVYRASLGERLMIVLGGPIINLVVGSVALITVKILFMTAHAPLSLPALINELAIWNLTMGLGALLPLSKHSGGWLAARLFKQWLSRSTATPPSSETRAHSAIGPAMLRDTQGHSTNGQPRTLGTLQISNHDGPNFPIHVVIGGGSRLSDGRIILDAEDIRREANIKGLPLSLVIQRTFLEELGHAVDRVAQGKRATRRLIRPNSALSRYLRHRPADQMWHDVAETAVAFRFLMFAKSLDDLKMALLLLSRTANEPEDKNHQWSARFVFDNVMRRLYPEMPATEYERALAGMIVGELPWPDLIQIRRKALELFRENLSVLSPMGELLPSLSDDYSDVRIPASTDDTLRQVFGLFESWLGRSLIPEAPLQTLERFVREGQLPPRMLTPDSAGEDYDFRNIKNGILAQRIQDLLSNGIGTLGLKILFPEEDLFCQLASQLSDPHTMLTVFLELHRNSHNPKSHEAHSMFIEIMRRAA
jgi:Glycosyltransferase family 9 (heptosyltransferase)